MKRSNDFGVVIAVFLIIVLCMSVIFFLTSSKRYFTRREPFYQVSIPELSTCGRDLEFMYNAEPKALASRRATTSTYNSGSCGITLKTSNGATYESAIVMDQNMTYILSSACISLRVLSAELDGETGVIFTFINSSLDDNIALRNFFLLNPVYVEFEGSEAYVLNSNQFNGASFSDTSPNEIKLSFKRLTPKSDLFKYPTSQNDSEAVTQVRNIITRFNNPKDSNKTPIALNIRLFFLSPQDENNLGRKLSLAPFQSRETGVHRAVIYDASNKAALQKEPERYWFNNKVIEILGANKKPIFTFNFEISITNPSTFVKKKTEIMKVYMKTSANVGSYNQCNNFESRGTKNNNIMSSYIDGTNSQNTFNLVFATGLQENGQSCVEDPKSTLAVALPYTQSNVKINVIVSVTPTNKILLCQWKDGPKKRFVYSKTQNCAEAKNNFERVLANRRATNEDSLNDIIMEYYYPDVDSINYVKLGHINYADMFNDS